MQTSTPKIPAARSSRRLAGAVAAAAVTVATLAGPGSAVAYQAQEHDSVSSGSSSRPCPTHACGSGNHNEVMATTG